MKKHRGSVLIVTLIFFAFVTVAMIAVLNLSVETQRSTAQSVVQTTVSYNLATMADLAVDAALYDLTTCSATVAAAFVGETTDCYAEGLNAIQAKIFPVDIYWIDDITYLVEYEGLPDEMQSAFSDASQGMELSITLSGNIEIQNSTSNVLLGEDGDYATLAPIALTVVLTQGMTMLERTYEISGLIAQFKHLTSGIYITIQRDDMNKQLVAQTIT